MDNKDGDLQTDTKMQELPLELLEGYFPTHFSEVQTTNIIKFDINTQRLLLKFSIISLRLPTIRLKV